MKGVGGGYGAFICGCCSSLLFEQLESWTCERLYLNDIMGFYHPRHRYVLISNISGSAIHISVLDLFCHFKLPTVGCQRIVSVIFHLAAGELRRRKIIAA